MIDDKLPELREKDWTVLASIAAGNDDVQRITNATTLKNYHVTYCFTKLADLGLIEVEKPEGYVNRHINGQKRVFQAPKEATLTETGGAYLDRFGTDTASSPYRHLDRSELVETVHELEREVEKLRREFRVFRRQVRRELK